MPNTQAVWKVLIGLALLCGMGFTMSLFITNLSFTDELLREEAKMAILIVSLISGVLGFIVLKSAIKNPEAISEDKIHSKDKQHKH